MNELFKAQQALVDNGINTIRFWLDEGYELEFAITAWENSTTAGPKLKAQVLAAFS